MSNVLHSRRKLFGYDFVLDAGFGQTLGRIETYLTRDAAAPRLAFASVQGPRSTLASRCASSFDARK